MPTVRNRRVRIKTVGSILSPVEIQEVRRQECSHDERGKSRLANAERSATEFRQKHIRPVADNGQNRRLVENFRSPVTDAVIVERRKQKLPKKKRIERVAVDVGYHRVCEKQKR